MSEHYITKYDGTNFTAYPYQLNVANDYLLTIDVDNDNVYVGSRFEGLLRLTDNGLTAIPLTDNQLYDCLLEKSRWWRNEVSMYLVFVSRTANLATPERGFTK